VVHSTSWRQARGGVVLTFLAVVDSSAVGSLDRVRPGRSGLTRGAATEAPGQVPAAAVIEHGLRHLAWLAQDDSDVAAALPDGWTAALQDYVPEPFRHL
jgi:hypothetical protein